MRKSITPSAYDEDGQLIRKMKKLLLLLATIIGFVPVYGQYFPVDTVELNAAYRDLAENPNTPQRQKRFFDAFPNTWKEFAMTYQFLPFADYDLDMYYHAAKHIEVLGNRVTLLPDSVYCKKLVKIAIGATLDADAPIYFQSLLHQTMHKKRDAMFREVMAYPKGFQSMFWQFYWSSICRSQPLEQEYKDLRKLTSDTYPEAITIMDAAFSNFYDGVWLMGDLSVDKQKVERTHSASSIH
ncbi:MAG: hypothetical protein LBM62_04485 [Mediterranea sp.]|jgi:hypothetical protein|nr:hypothetical protein [Mediterranea sp.]